MPPRTRSSARVRTQPDSEEPGELSSTPSVGPRACPLTNTQTLELPTSSDHDGMTSSAEDSEPETSKPKPGKRTRNDYEDSEPPTQPMVKRARGKQGKLQGVMNMPIEVFTE
ncbi:hypothetical protein FRC09_000775, partial [Ceratobasidium sp. 395]